MDIDERLKKEKMIDLKRLASKLKVTGYSKLNKQALIDHIKANCSEQEIEAIINVKLTWKRSEMDYEVFISHASEDKEDVVRPLSAHLKKQGLSVWLDEFEMTLGDSLRRSIDRGLSRSGFGVVILSPAFFSKEWPNRELDGLVAREENTGKVILPIWHNVSRDEVLKFSPTLADRLAVSTSRGIKHVAEQIIIAVARAANNDDNLIIKFAPREKDHLKELREKMIVARSPWELRSVVYELEEYLSKYPNAPEARLFEYQVKKALHTEEVRSCNYPRKIVRNDKAILKMKKRYIFIRLLSWLTILIMILGFILMILVKC